MAIIFTEGFDAYGTSPTGTNLGIYLLRKWGSLSDPGPAFALTTGRIAGRAFVPNQNRYVNTPNLGNNVDTLIGVAFNPTNMTDANQKIIALYEDSNEGMNVRLTSGGELAVYKGASLLQTTSGLGITTGVWKAIEFHVFTNASTGTYTLKLGGTTVLSDTSQNTVANSNVYYNAVRFGATGSTSAYGAFDDIYIRNDSTFLLDWKIKTVFPDADNSVDATPSTGSDNYAMVDDTEPDGDSTYVDAGDTNKDLYDFASMGETGLVHAVAVNAVCRESDATPFDITLKAKSSLTTGSGTTVPVGGTTYVNKWSIFAVNPDTTAAWTPSEVDAAQFGFQIDA